MLLSVASAAIIAMLPATAFADDAGWYLRGNAGYGTHNDIDITGDLVGDVESEGNATGSVGLGYDFGNNWRLELDAAQLFTDLGQISQTPSSSAKLETTTGFLNAIYDFSDFGRWEPYVGAGIGIVRGNVTAVAHDFPTGGAGSANISTPVCSGVACSFKDGDTGLGWQLLAGLGYEISDNLTWDTHYRYMNSNNLDFTGSVAPVIGSLASAAATFEDVGSHALMTGFRYRFGEKAKPVVAAPAPVPVPAPVPSTFTCWDGSSALDLANCPAEPAPAPEPVRQVQCWDGSIVTDAAQCPAQQTYTCPDGSLVYDQNQCIATRSEVTIGELCGQEYRSETIYYDFNKARSAETQSKINRILDIGQFCNVESISVVGHTDTVGSSAYNQRLSERRANDAREELIRDGVDAARISASGAGETQLFVQTADGVKEDLNRRTEVLIRLSNTQGAIQPGF
jgi:outer membrane protein OmpA-like peptidoglycan-associated protein/opacity protein-like surface antigen